MKKIIFVLGFLSVLLLFSGLFLSKANAVEFLNQNSLSEDNNYWRGMMNNNYDSISYEREYMHLSEEDRVVFDEIFAQELIASNIGEVTLEEAIELLDNIKRNILENNNNYTFQSYGSMMQNYNLRDSHCGNSEPFDSSYEWYYVHTYGADKDLLEQKYVELLQSVNYDELSVDDIIVNIAQAKEDAVIYLIESYPSND
ncbi:hypothetical protein [Peloplasma aerotolerans]|uniref:Uncharacterized protein n=1 Tax=Peloplasma aerotolerans TaxID=3044389 RepID=A0AAW6U4F0_9MOLU|nr:hypothetical protein [Mariniplasma sp. M4Ah]MDI6452858.1 hypothetical protein [Mariniplasma sp. M4Ah]